MKTLRKGENALFILIFTNENGVEINYDDMAEFEVTFVQGDAIVQTYTKSDNHIRKGGEDYEVEVELTTTLSNLFVIGKPVSLKFKISVSDDDFDVDSNAVDIIEKKYFNVVR